MKPARAAARQSQLLLAARRSAAPRQHHRCVHQDPGQAPPKRSGNALKFAAAFGLSAAAAYYYPTLLALVTGPAPEPSLESVPARPQRAQLEFEKKPETEAQGKGGSQVVPTTQDARTTNGWDKPGVYLWGANSNGVADPSTSSDKFVKAPRRLAFFDGQVLRSLKLSRKFGVAVTEKGDLVQWGRGFSRDNPLPTITLQGHDIVEAAISQDRVIALSSKGKVYSLPASKDDQDTGTKPLESSTQGSGIFPLWSSAPKIASANYNDLTPSLGRGEKVTSISSGQEHCLMLTNKGRVFSAAASTTSFPSKGQMGIGGLTWDSRPPGPYYQPHEILDVSKFRITQIATGAYHSVLLSDDNSIFTFGDNTFGQLALPSNASQQPQFQPVRPPLTSAKSATSDKLLSIAAGGFTTYLTREVVADNHRYAGLYACGKGIHGALGNGRWTHVQSELRPIASLSGLTEFNEKTGRLVPIFPQYISAGAGHTAVVLDNNTQMSAPDRKATSSTSWGADVLVWGANEYFQLGTGKRTNVNEPSYISALEAAGDSQMRLQLMPRQKMRIGDGRASRMVELEQGIECGEDVTAVYSRT